MLNKSHPFKLTWYIGNVMEKGEVLKEKVVKAIDFSKVKLLKILPKSELAKHGLDGSGRGYFRIIFINPDVEWSVDYGSWSRFIYIEKLD